MKPRARPAGWPPYRGFAPIATCHWQCIANIFALYDLPDAEIWMCPAWGIRWPGGGTLYGSGGWRDMLKALLDATVREHTAASRAEASDIETQAASAGRMYVPEVDAWFLPSPYAGTEHIVHTVVVASLTSDDVTIIDPMNNPAPAIIPLSHYWQMREHSAAGRLEPFKLYIPEPGPYRGVEPANAATLARQEIAAQATRSIRDLAAFINWLAGTDEPTDVCRVAGERHQAAIFFDALADRGVDAAKESATLMSKLRDDWYLLHLLTTHEKADQARMRRRLRRMLGDLLAAETAFASEAGAP